MEGVSPTVQDAVRPVPEEGFQLPDKDVAGGDAHGGAGRDGNANPDGNTGAGANADAGVPRQNLLPLDTPPPGPTGTESTRRGSTGGPSVASVPPVSPGTYQVVGTVLADVESEPIFADKVLAVLDSALAAEARKYDENQFRAEAARLIRQQVHEFVYNALEFAMARSRLDARDQQLAKGAAIKWREEQITQAGGSVERARQTWAARGFDYEDRVDEQYRTFMRQLYYQRKEAPKIQVSASDLRRYYQENLRTEFTEPEKAHFRVIAIDIAKSGGRQQALGEINKLLDRARSGGVDFAELAAQDNDRDTFKRDAGWIPRGSFVIPQVEEAAWKLEPGKISDVIEAPDAFYIVKVLELEKGRVRPFRDREVQAKIERTLRDRQFAMLRSNVQHQLVQDAIIRYHPDEQGMLQTAVEMAAQKYRYWRTAAR
jgi:parvulin-like peptidyl-prolyl isomerase